MQDLAPSQTPGLLSIRLQELMKKKDFNITKLAKATGAGVATIQRILSDLNCNPTYLTLKAIADALEVSIGELLGETNTQLMRQYKVKLIEWNNILKHLESKKPIHITEKCDVISSSVEVSQKAFALKLPISQMFSIFHENSTLIFDPLKKVYDRCYVLVKLHSHPTVVLKQLIKDEPFSYIKSVSPLLADSIVELKESDKILATLVQSMIKH